MHYLPDYYYIVGEADKLNTSGPFHIDCAFCNGTGVHPSTMSSLTHSRCPACYGTGLLHFNGSRTDYSTCRWCEGTGREPQQTPIKPCTACRGRGIL